MLQTDKKQRKQKNIRVSKLRIYDKNAGNPKNISAIADSVREYGILAPLIVIGPDASGVYDILDGDGRYQAVCMINDMDGKQTIRSMPCYVVSDTKDENLVKNIKEQLKLGVKDSAKREAYRFETVISIIDQSERGEIAKKDVINKIQTSLGVTPRYARMYKTIYDSGIQELQESVKCTTHFAEQKRALNKGNESVRVHIRIALAAKIASFSKAEQEEILDRIYKGEKVDVVLEQFKQNRINVEV